MDNNGFFTVIRDDALRIASGISLLDLILYFTVWCRANNYEECSGLFIETHEVLL